MHHYLFWIVNSVDELKQKSRQASVRFKILTFWPTSQTHTIIALDFIKKYLKIFIITWQKITTEKKEPQHAFQDLRSSHIRANWSTFSWQDKQHCVNELWYLSLITVLQLTLNSFLSPSIKFKCTRPSCNSCAVETVSVENSRLQVTYKRLIFTTL